MEAKKPTVGLLWKVFFILLIVTLLEFTVAFTFTSEKLHTWKIVLFVVMTFVKAYYIVGTFMHLKYETMFFKRAVIIFPLILLIWFIVALLMEGGYFGVEKLF